MSRAKYLYKIYAEYPPSGLYPNPIPYGMRLLSTYEDKEQSDKAVNMLNEREEKYYKPQDRVTYKCFKEKVCQ